METTNTESSDWLRGARGRRGAAASHLAGRLFADATTTANIGSEGESGTGAPTFSELMRGALANRRGIAAEPDANPGDEDDDPEVDFYVALGQQADEDAEIVKRAVESYRGSGAMEDDVRYFRHYGRWP